jgi:hypothetical protein
MIQGDQPTMQFTCNDATGLAHDLTGATGIEAHFPQSGGGTLVIPTAGGTITLSNQTTNKGQLTVDFSGVDTTTLKPGKNLSVLIKITQSGRVLQFKGIALDVDSSQVG